MKKISALLLAFSCLSLTLFAEEPAEKPAPKIKAKVYGFVRGDASFDTRESVASFEGLFLLYPKDIRLDATGKDLSAVPSAGFYAFNSRVGLDITGAEVFKASLSGKIEADFAGFGGSFGSNFSVLRIRQAYIKMAWKRSNLIVGQTWHPLFGPVTPEVISLSVGAPFNPFNRSPLVRYNYTLGRFTFSGAAIWEFQFTSTGPGGKSTTYQRKAVWPEFYLGGDYRHGPWTAGAGLRYLTIKPRTESIQPDGSTYKVYESLGSLAGTVYANYTRNLLSVSLKTILGGNLADQTMLGGYGISAIEPVTGEQQYTNFLQSTTWAGVSYGKKFKGGLFGGYSRNLGSCKDLIENSAVYGEGLTLNELYRFCATFSYNVPHFMLGAEYEMTSGAYGDAGSFDYAKGRYTSSHSATNHRLVGVIAYLF